MHAEAQRPSQTKFPRAGSHGYATNGEIARSRTHEAVQPKVARARRCRLQWRTVEIHKKGMHTYGHTQ